MSMRQFLIENKWYWILPIVLVLGLVGFILWSSSTDGAAGGDEATPFQYDLY
jgi:hypothetical protein